MNYLLCACSLALTLAACGDNSAEISDQPLQGTVGGEAWSFVGGDTNAFLSDENDFFTVLYGAAGEACGFAEPAGNKLILSIPTQPGDYNFSTQRTMTFVVEGSDGPENLVATDGRLVVDAVTATTISGGVIGRFDGDNQIDGNFSATICSD